MYRETSHYDGLYMYQQLAICNLCLNIDIRGYHIPFCYALRRAILRVTPYAKGGVSYADSKSICYALRQIFQKYDNFNPSFERFNSDFLTLWSFIIENVNSDIELVVTNTCCASVTSFYGYLR